MLSRGHAALCGPLSRCVMHACSQSFSSALVTREGKAAVESSNFVQLFPVAQTMDKRILRPKVAGSRSPGVVLKLETTEVEVAVETSNFVEMLTSKVKTMRSRGMVCDMTRIHVTEEQRSAVN